MTVSSVSIFPDSQRTVFYPSLKRKRRHDRRSQSSDRCSKPLGTSHVVHQRQKSGVGGGTCFAPWATERSDGGGPTRDRQGAQSGAGRGWRLEHRCVAGFWRLGGPRRWQVWLEDYAGRWQERPDHTDFFQ
ncbi:hypothetical protein D3C76_1360550 [compost metagenome]